MDSKSKPAGKARRGTNGKAAKAASNAKPSKSGKPAKKGQPSKSGKPAKGGKGGFKGGYKGKKPKKPVVLTKEQKKVRASCWPPVTHNLTVVAPQELKKLRKSGKHGELLDKAKQLWYTIRTKTTSTETRNESVETLLQLVKDKARPPIPSLVVCVALTHDCCVRTVCALRRRALQMLDVVQRHDASRIVQCILQFGNNDQRDQVLKVRTICCSCGLCDEAALARAYVGRIAQELKGHWLEFSKSRHAHFLVRKVFRYCSEPQRLEVASELEGHVARLATQSFGVVRSVTPRLCSVWVCTDLGWAV